MMNGKKFLIPLICISNVWVTLRRSTVDEKSVPHSIFFLSSFVTPQRCVMKRGKHFNSFFFLLRNKINAFDETE